MDVTEWLKRLEDNFTVKGIIGGNLLEIFDQERICGEYFANKFHGQGVLIDSFQSFYVETIMNAIDWVAAHGWPKDCDYYAPLLFYYITTFRGFRACENLLLKGYPLDGYGLLRDLKDRCIFLAGIAHNITSFPALFGIKAIKGKTIEEWQKIKKGIKKEEHHVLGKMIRKDSGLPEEISKELYRWEQMFHEQVHGSKFTFFLEGGDWMKGKGPISVGPLPNERSMAMYMNRAAEIGWMLTRLLLFLQPVQDAFGVEWKKRYSILDDSFSVMVRSLGDMGKKIADAFIFFIDTKFSFPKNFHYLEADGSL